jgi:hypothetical protein
MYVSEHAFERELEIGEAQSPGEDDDGAVRAMHFKEDM